MRKTIITVFLMVLTSVGAFARTGITQQERNTVNRLTGWGVLENYRTYEELNQPLSAIDTMSFVIKHGNHIEDKISDNIDDRVFNEVNKFDYRMKRYEDRLNRSVFDTVTKKIEDSETETNKQIEELKNRNNNLTLLVIAGMILNFIL